MLDYFLNAVVTLFVAIDPIGLAPLYAVLSFLRGEGDAYTVITARAGEYAADWTVSSMPFARRWCLKSRSAGSGIFAATGCPQMRRACWSSRR